MGGGRHDLWRIVADNPEVDPLVTRTRAWRGAEIPAGGGNGNARAVAEIHMILANNDVAKGRRFLSEAGCRRALEPQVQGVDLVLGVPMRFGLGFALGTGLMPNDNTLYWGRLRRFAGRRRPGRAHHDRVHPEQDVLDRDR